MQNTPYKHQPDMTNNMWDDSIPTKGKAAEKGCEGCPWYDIEKWRRMLNEKIKKEE